MKKILKKYLIKGGLYSFCLMFLLCTAALLLRYHSTEAAGIYTEPGTNTANRNWTYPVKCHTITKEDGTVMLFYSVLNEKKQQTLAIDLIDDKGKCTHYKRLPVPGETWGGTVYQAPDGCNYITTGNSGDIAFFVMKYSADWTLLGTTSITKEESYTDTAFRGGNSDMTMAGDYLIVHTARLRKDGHQSNFTSWIDTKTMEPVSIADEFPTTHVSHSFSQFVRYDGKHIIMIDQGDGHPRGISMITQLPDLDNKSTEKSVLMGFWGKTGDNFTGATVDGFELGSKHHLVVGSSIPHDRFTSEAEYKDYVDDDELKKDYVYADNLYVILIDPISGVPQLKWLTNNLSGKTSNRIENLEMIKLTDDEFLLLYDTCKGTIISDDDYEESHSTNYMLIDSEGNIKKTGEMDKKLYCTSEPSYNDGILTWCHYVESELGNFMVLYRWNIETGACTVQNIDIGFASKIRKIARTDDQKEYKSGENFEITLKVFSEIFDEHSATAPAVWKSSDNSVIQVLEEETILSDASGRSSTDLLSNKAVSSKCIAKKQGTATITCMIGDKKWSAKLKVKGTTAKPGKVKKLKVKYKKNGKVVVSWGKVAGAEYYQLQCSTRKNFKKKTTMSGIRKKKITVYLTSKRKKTYYFRVRAYKWVSNKRVYGKWSKVVKKKYNKRKTKK